MIKLKSLFALSASVAILAGCQNPMSKEPEQAKLLHTWANDNSLTLDDIVKKAADFDRNMNPEEGISCIRADANGYERLVHPDPTKMENPRMFSVERAQAFDKIRAAVDGKMRPEGVQVDYSVDKMQKVAMVYPITNDTVCLAFWLAPNAQAGEDV